MSNIEIQELTPEQAVITKYVAPAENALEALNSAVVRNKDGEIVRVDIRSDKQYEVAGQVLADGRKKRSEFERYWKTDPKRPQSECSPGEGHGFFARRMWESANAIFNAYNDRLTRLFGTTKEGGLIDAGMTAYRQEVERKAREEAEARAAEERKRLEAEAAELRRKAEEERRIQEEKLRQEREAAEKERKRLEAIAAEERRKAEEERQAKLKAELEAAKSKKQAEEAKRRAEEEKRRLEEEAARAAQEAEQARRIQEIAEEESRQSALDAEAKAQREAEEKIREADNVVVMPTRSAPVSAGASVRKKWKAEVVSLEKLVQSVSQGKAPLACLTFDQSGCDKLAQAFGGVNAPSGLRFYMEETTASRSRKA